MIRLPFPPSLNNAYPTSRSGHRYPSKELTAFKSAAGFALRAARAEKMAGPVVVQIDVYRPRKRGDLDGFSKAVLDAMTGICFDDDEQVEALIMRRYEDKADPRCEVLCLKLVDS